MTPISQTSIGHDGLVETLQGIVDDDNCTVNERYLAEYFLAVYTVAQNHPGVIDVVNKFALRAIERNEEVNGS